MTSDATPPPDDGTSPPDGNDDQTPEEIDEETQERHVASRAKLLPEEQAVGSDDPQAQAEAILGESEERTEHPDRDTSL